MKEVEDSENTITQLSRNSQRNKIITTKYKKFVISVIF